MGTLTAKKSKQVKVRGLLVNPPGGGEPRVVYVNEADDWEIIYRHPEAEIRCLEPGCPTLLTAKQMSKSGLRFFACRRGMGTCSHFTTDLPIMPGDEEVIPTAPGTGGGPEGAEHLWIKGRLATIARKRLHERVVVEESMTHADVYLPDRGLVLEYQRWDTDIAKRDQDRRDAGARKTIWLFPESPSRHRKFNDAVKHGGAMYLAVRSKRTGRWRSVEPWAHPEQNYGAFLFVSGSIVTYDVDYGRLVRCRKSLPEVLTEILSGARVQREVPVFTKKTGKAELINAWVLLDDLAKAQAARAERLAARRKNRPAPAAPVITEPQLIRQRRDEAIASEERVTGVAPLNPVASESTGPQAPGPSTAAENPWLTEPHTDPARYSRSPVEATEVEAPSPVVLPEAACAPATSMWSRIRQWFRHN